MRGSRNEKCLGGHDESDNCPTSIPNPSLCQQLEEMDFQRGIWQAALDDDVDKITELVNHKNIHPDTTDDYGYTALHYAARNDKMKAAKELIRLGANVNCQTKSNKSSPLHRAGLSGHVNMTQLLLDAGADVTLLDTDLLTPLERAKKEGKLEIVRILQNIINQ